MIPSGVNAPPLTLRTWHADQVAGTSGRAAGVKVGGRQVHVCRLSPRVTGPVLEDERMQIGPVQRRSRCRPIIEPGG